MVGSTAIWRIILLHTAMLSLHISVVNFNVQPSINKYQVVITLLSAKKKIHNSPFSKKCNRKHLPIQFEF